MLYRENHRPVGSHWQTLSHNVINATTIFNSAIVDFFTQNLTGIDCTVFVLIVVLYELYREIGSWHRENHKHVVSHWQTLSHKVV